MGGVSKGETWLPWEEDCSKWGGYWKPGYASTRASGVTPGWNCCCSTRGVSGASSIKLVHMGSGWLGQHTFYTGPWMMMMDSCHLVCFCCDNESCPPACRKLGSISVVYDSFLGMYPVPLCLFRKNAMVVLTDTCSRHKQSGIGLV